MSCVLSATVHAQDPAQNKQGGVRGRVVVEPALLAATEGPLPEALAAALRTTSYVKRPRGRPVARMMGPMPDLQVVIEGEEIRAEAGAPKTIVIEGYRFTPADVLLTRPGPVAIENKQASPVTVLQDKVVVDTIAPGETKQVTLAAGEHLLSVREMPFALCSTRVLERGMVLPLDDNGDVPFVPLVDGEYSVSFWLGTERLFQPTAFALARNGLNFIDATVSANRVVTVAIKDASLQVAVPVAPIRQAPPPEPEQ